MTAKDPWKYHPFYDGIEPSLHDVIEFQRFGETEVERGVVIKPRKLWVEVDGLIMGDENCIEKWRYASDV